MAIVHKATVKPTKLELVTAWLDRRPWGASGEVETVGSFRFDDPEGEVGVEAILVRRAGSVLVAPLTYRGAPLTGAEEHLVGTMEHSVLGDRWIYDAVGDPVAVGCFVRALRGEQAQAEIEIWDGGSLVERRAPGVRVRAERGSAAGAARHVATAEVDGGRLAIARTLDNGLDGERRLVAEWADGRAVVAAWSTS